MLRRCCFRVLTLLKTRDTLLKRGDLQHDGVGRMDVVKLFTAEPDDASRHADDRRVVRHLAQDDGIGRDAGVISDPKRPKHLRAGA